MPPGEELGTVLISSRNWAGRMLVKAFIAAATDDMPTKEDRRSVDNESALTSSSTEGWYLGEASSHSKREESLYWSLYSLSLASRFGTALVLIIYGDAIEEL